MEDFARARDQYAREFDGTEDALIELDRRRCVLEHKPRRYGVETFFGAPAIMILLVLDARSEARAGYSVCAREMPVNCEARNDSLAQVVRRKRIGSAPSVRSTRQSLTVNAALVDPSIAAGTSRRPPLLR